PGHRSGRAHLLQCAEWSVVCGDFGDLTVGGREERVCGHLPHPGEFAAALCDLRAGLRCDARGGLWGLHARLSRQRSVPGPRRGLWHGLLLSALHRERLGGLAMHRWIWGGVCRTLGYWVRRRVWSGRMVGSVVASVVGAISLGLAAPFRLRSRKPQSS